MTAEPGKGRALALATGVLLLLVGLATLLSAAVQFFNALTRQYGSPIGFVVVSLALGAGLTFTGQWLVRRGGLPGWEAQTSRAFKLLALAAALIGTLAGGCVAAFARFALDGDPYVVPVWTVGLITAGVALALAWLFWRAAKGMGPPP